MKTFLPRYVVASTRSTAIKTVALCGLVCGMTCKLLVRLLIGDVTVVVRFLATLVWLRLAVLKRFLNSGLIPGLCFFVGAVTLLKLGDRVQHRVALPNGRHACILCSRQTLRKKSRDD